MTLSEGIADPRPVPVSKMVGLLLILIALLISLLVVACRRLKVPDRAPAHKPPPAAPAEPTPPTCGDGQFYSDDLQRCATPD